ncbi:FecR family protein [Deminuibacter soli]|uniref:DUF4974 domain-containing protein n=1 Tax=Deminuibacter soli TaxID=2291815 RepID=A0A3E1NIV7_9BACT|nr:FecR family protein [Deminuibacter soli]RFM27754.1 DUF4974 domain-containing protein [Deminuibacter soli]
MMQQQRLRQLLQLRIEQKLTGEEALELDAALADEANAPMIQALLEALYDELPQTHTLAESAADAMFQQVVQPEDKPVMRKRRLRGRYAALLVAGVLLASTGVWLLYKPKHAAVLPLAQKTVTHDVAPGGNKATLTLADGSSIVLDDAGNGTLTQQGNTKVIKLGNGQLAYNTAGGSGKQSLFNTISTPRGGQYQVVLPDGSKVWLNAASTLRFPAAFPATEREVELSGEGYFEVAAATTPFKVKVNNISVDVLGTHFNINAYPDETGTRTTLLQGAVKISSASGQNILKPGEEGAADNNGGIHVKAADTEDAVAWKNGIFSFHGDDVQTVMRALSRWYDVQVSYEGKIPEHRFEGRIWRNYTLAQALAVLQASDVHFKIENRNLVVLP